MTSSTEGPPSAGPESIPNTTPHRVPPSDIEASRTDEAGFRKHFERVANNLFSLEINTIIKDGITATRMPPTAHALMDIANEYDAMLQKLGTIPPKNSDTEASWWEFDDLRTRAKQIYDGMGRIPGRSYSQADLLMLSRIRDNSDQIKGIFEALKARSGGVDPVYTRGNAPSVSLLPMEVVTVRKIWEIGTETIAMQTVIHLNGDVITRMQELYTKPENRFFIEVHDNAVQTSTGFWHRLVDTVSAFMKGVGELFLGK